MKTGFKHRVAGLLFSMAAGIGAPSLMSGPLDWAGAPKPQRGIPLSFDKNGNGKDAYGRSYIRKSGVIIRNDFRVSKLSRRARKAIWSGK